jgi:hypothetical protein
VAAESLELSQEVIVARRIDVDPLKHTRDVGLGRRQ